MSISPGGLKPARHPENGTALEYQARDPNAREDSQPHVPRTGLVLGQLPT